MQLAYLYLAPLCLAIAAVFIVVEKLEKYLVADVIKGVASAFFVLLGILGFHLSNDALFARWVLAGLILGMVADILLNLRYVYDGTKSQLVFLAGIAVFLLGHLAYIMACLPHCPLLPFAICLGVVLAALLLYWIFKHIEAKVTFKVFGIFYIGIITILNCIALTALFGTPNGHWLLFFTGTLLFLASDVILILNTFGPKKSLIMRVSNLMLYYIAQLLIAASLQLPL